MEYSRVNISLRWRAIQVLLKRPLTKRGLSDIEALIRQWVAVEGVGCRGLLKVLRSYILDEVYCTPDGKRYKFSVGEWRCHRRNRQIVRLVDELTQAGKEDE